MERQTTFAKPSTVDQKWHVIDAEGQVLGRLATRLATILQGKHKPQYTPFIDTGDFIVVINAKGIVLTGRKAEQKVHKRFTGYPGGLKQIPYGKLLAEKPERLIELAVKRMLPKSSLGAKMFTKMKVYAGSDHPHQAQQPQPLAV